MDPPVPHVESLRGRGRGRHRGRGRGRARGRGVNAPDEASNVLRDEEEVLEPPRARRRLDEIAPHVPLMPPPAPLVPPDPPLVPPPPAPAEQAGMAMILQRLDDMQREMADIRREQQAQAQAQAQIRPPAPHAQGQVQIQPPAPQGVLPVDPAAPLAPPPPAARGDVPAPVGRRQIPDEGISMMEFLKLRLPEFRGALGEDPQDFLDSIEIVVLRLGCSEVRMIDLVALLLRDRAASWYSRHIPAQLLRERPITWAEFREQLTGEFLTPGLRDSRSRAFETLTQGTSSVEQYAEEFIRLSRYFGCD